jgi:transposase
MSEEKKDPDYLNFSIRVTDNRTRDYLLKVVMSYLHLRNMLLILIKRNREEHQAQPEHRPDLFRYLTNSRIMRALLWRQTGGLLSEKVQFMQQYYNHDEMMQEAMALGFGLKDKIISEMVKQLLESWKSFFAKIKSGDRLAREPKARRLKDCRGYSLPIDMECVSFRKNTIKLLLERGHPFTLHCNHKALLDHVGSLESIKRMEICLRNDDIYLLFSYLAPSKKAPIPIQLEPKYAGLDLGVLRLVSVYVHDENSPSFAVDGGIFSSHNAEFNRRMAALKSQLDPLKHRLRIFEKAAREQGYIPYRELLKDRDYRHLCQARDRIQKKISKLLRKRRHFLDSNFKKLAVRLLMTLQGLAVTHLVTSRNIIEKKSLGANMGAVQNQKFYFLPLGKLVDLLKLFGPRYGITVIDKIDEAYTSKTSALSGDVIKAQELFKDRNNQDAALRSDVFQGRRVKRGLYQDRPSGKVIHADINAAVNILKLHLRDPSLFEDMARKMFKLANPRIIRKNALLCLLDSPYGFPCVAGEQAQRAATLLSYPLNTEYAQV